MNNIGVCSETKTPFSIRRLTEEVKCLAINEGADLVGIAPVERFKNAPLIISPQGHLPEAKSVLVAAIHIPDGCIEFGAEPEPEMTGPYHLTWGMIFELNSIGFKIAKFLETKGYQTIPIACTGYYRYSRLKGKGLNTPLLPDLSHIHAAAAAGMGEIGWSGMLLTPEYGPRQRFVTVITDAFLEPDPMYEGPPLCDKCMECTKYCKVDTYKKEADGVNKVEIGGKVFRYPKINKLRCDWRHGFNADANVPVPEKINEETMLNYAEYGEQGYCCSGYCLRYCMSPHLRYHDANYCNPPRRKRQFVANNNFENKAITDKVKAIAIEAGADLISIIPFDKVKHLNLEQIPPDTKSLIIVATRFHYEKEGSTALSPLYKKMVTIYSRLMCIERLVINYLEKFGYTSLPWEPAPFINKKGWEASPETELKEKNIIKASGLAGISDKISPVERQWRNNNSKGTLITPEYRERQDFRIVVTSAPLVSDRKESELKVSLHPKKLTKFLDKELKTFAFQKGVDLFGIASLERITQVIDALEKHYPQTHPVANYGWENKEWKAEYEDIKLKRPEDHLRNVKSIIVIGVHYPDAVVDRALEPPSYTVGPYAYVHEQSLKELGYLALDICRFLEDMGYKALPTDDLLGLASKTKRDIPDATANRYAAICAGLGELGWHGAVLTPQYGVRQRLVSIVTDASLKPDNLYEGLPLCKRCFKCVENDPTNSISKKEKIVLTIDGRTFEHAKVDRARRDWSHRYGLIAEEGPSQRGSNINIMPPEKITPKSIADAVKQLNPLSMHYLLVVEKYLKVCPAHQGIGEKHK